MAKKAIPEQGDPADRPHKGGQPLQAKYSDNPAMMTEDPDAYLRALMADPKIDVRLRTQAALSLRNDPKTKAAKPEGKKQQQAAQAETVAQGRFAPNAAPKLHAVK